MEKKRTTVRIAGHDYTLSSYDSVEHVERVAKFVDRMINDVALSTRLPAVQVTALAAMNIADDMIKARDENAQLKRRLDEMQKRLDDIATGKPQ